MHGQTLQQNANENELVERARRMDPVAIRLFIKRQNQRLYRIARSIVRDDSDAEDVLQEAYVRAFAGLEGFRGEARIGTWLARIVINEALSWRRRRRRTIGLSPLPTDAGLNAQIIPFPSANCIADPETTIAQSEIHMLLERAIDGLPNSDFVAHTATARNKDWDVANQQRESAMSRSSTPATWTISAIFIRTCSRDQLGRGHARGCRALDWHRVGACGVGSHHF
jgi:RNA polymerase sigma factor (sigma-70 family)